MNSISRKYIRVFEHETLKYGNERPISESQFNALVKFNDKNENKYFTIVHKGIKFKQYVGVIRVDDLTIEILPKIDKDKDRELAHNFLIDLLKKCKKLEISSISKTNLKIRYNNLLEYYLQLYLDELYILAKNGFVKKYRFEEDNLPVLKGKLLTTEQINKNGIHKERFCIRYQKYDFNHLLNQILMEAFYIIPQITNNQSLLANHQQLQLILPEIRKSKLSSNFAERIKYDRKTQRYHNAIELAIMIISNYNPDIIHGRNNLIAILFDMNKLFEEYIYRVLKKAVDDETKVELHRRKQFWKSKLILPDILVTKSDQKFIIDTKWKTVTKKNPADSDLKQMYVYNEYFDTKESILLYPRSAQSEPTSAYYHTKSHSCRMEFVDLVKEGKLNLNIGKDISELIFDYSKL